MTKEWAVEYWDGTEWGLLDRNPWTSRGMTETQAKAEADDIRARGVEARAVSLASVRDLLGIAPDFTADKSADEWISEHRDQV